jgi:hypothetical protein
VTKVAEDEERNLLRIAKDADDFRQFGSQLEEP